VIVRFCSFGALDHQRRVLHRSSLLYLSEDRDSTSYHGIDYPNVENDEDISPLHTMQGPITRAYARQLDLQVCSNLVNCFSKLTLGSMHVLLIRNNEEDQQGLGEGQGLKEEELGRPHQGGVHVQLDFDSTSDFRTLLYENRRPGHIRSRICAFYIWLEPEFYRASNGTNPTSKLLLSRRKLAT
jgi:hypothetical protein